MRSTRSALLALLLASTAAACSSSEPLPVSTAADVNDVSSFEHFIAGHPTPDEFRARYPKVQLVMPGDITTRELRMDRTRYFAELDQQQRIIGGRFQ